MQDFHGLTYDQFCKAVSTPDNIFPKGISDAVALQILFDHFIDSDYYIFYSCGRTQANTEMVAYILERYPAGKLKKIPKFAPKMHSELDEAIKCLNSL